WRLRPARLLLRLTRDLNAAESLYLRLLVPACAALAVALLISYWLLHQGHPWLAAAMLLWLLGAGLGVMLWLLRASAQATLSLSRHAEHMRLQALDLTGAQAELSMAGRFDEALAGVYAREAHLAQLESRLQSRDALASALWQALHALTLGAATLCAAALVFEGGATAATAAFFILVCMAAMEPFTALRRGASQWAATALAARRLRPALQPQHETTESALPVPDVGFAVQLQGVHTLRTDRIGGAADGVTLEVACGECVALVGTSGSGKSTLLALIAGLLQPAAGSVRALPSMGLLQQTALFADSVRANLDLRQRGLPDETLWAALRAVALDEVIAERGGLDALLGEGGTGFSRGQQRRLVLARLLLSDDYNFWLLDEPSDGLDAQSASGVLDHLAGALRGRTGIIATHLRREAALADRLVLVESGCITMRAVRGTPAFDALLARLRDD
ncbi:MAG: ATP-binding cassette domain-containing protein, partial [Ottowia sp.]|nr:ATP-binding cassette domain-containing protein [Ottowia sp.]